MRKMSKKEKKYVSRAIAQKLKRLGISDQIQMVPTGSRLRKPVLDEKGQLQFNSQGLVITEVVDLLRASNVFRNTIRTLRNGNPDNAYTFLNLPEEVTAPTSES